MTEEVKKNETEVKTSENRDARPSGDNRDNRENRPSGDRQYNSRPSGDRDNRRPRQGGGFKKRAPRRKVCRFCAEKMDVDYTNVRVLRTFITERAKIVPSRITGTCAKHQRQLTVAVKRARSVALIPYTSAHDI